LDYLLIHDADRFERKLKPAFADSWSKRSFDPCQALCQQAIPAARLYASRYQTDGEASLPILVARGLAFDRACWRALVGELLLYLALEIPELPTHTEGFCHILGPSSGLAEQRESWPPIRQVLEGSRDLTFGSAVYRPLHAGYNTAGDVARLAAYLASVQPASWQTTDLIGLADLEEADREDELEFLREWFPVLAQVYHQAAECGRIIILERAF
jgi:hypothetical protein